MEASTAGVSVSDPPSSETAPDTGRAPAAPEVRRKRGRPRDPEADGRILAAASSLILMRGFESMTVDEVASNAGVGKATVYRCWPTKELLVADVAGARVDDGVLLVRFRRDEAAGG